MKSKRRALLIVTIILLAALSACDKGAPVEAAATPTPPPQTEPAPATPAAKKEPVARYTADGKRIITIGTWYERYYVSKHTAIEDDPNLAFPETAQMRLERVREIEKKYNVVLEFVNLTFDGVQESISTSVPEGAPDVEIYEVDIQFGIPFVFSDYAVSLEEMGLSDTDVFTSQTVLKHLNLAGQKESYLFAPSSTGAVNAYVLAFNMDMINAAGLENPQDVYDRGEWTWEVFRQYLKVLTHDNNSDGSTEVYGFSGYWTHLLRNLLMSNGATIAAGEQEGLSSPETMEVLTFIDELYNIDKTARPWDASNWNINNELYAAGLSGFWVGSDWLFGEQGGADLPFEIGVVPWPCGPSGNAETNKHSQPQSNWYFIPKGVEDPRFVYDVIYDWINWYDGDLSVGVDLKWSQNMYMTERNFEYALMMDQNPGFDMWESLGVDFSVVPMIQGEMTPSALVEENKVLYQDALNNYFGE